MPQDRARPGDPAARASPRGPVTVTGLLRITEPGGGFLRRNDPAAGRWYSRDVAAIAAARGLETVAPYFIDADATPNPGGLPVGGLTVVTLPQHPPQLRAHLVRPRRRPRLPRDPRCPLTEPDNAAARCVHPLRNSKHRDKYASIINNMRFARGVAPRQFCDRLSSCSSAEAGTISKFHDSVAVIAAGARQAQRPVLGSAITGSMSGPACFWQRSPRSSPTFPGWQCQPYTSPLLSASW